MPIGPVPGMIETVQPVFVASILPVSLGLLFAIGAAARRVYAIVPTFLAVAASFVPDLIAPFPGPFSQPLFQVPFRQAIFLFGPFLWHYFSRLRKRRSKILLHLIVYPIAIFAQYVSTPDSPAYLAIQVLRVVHVLGYCLALAIALRTDHIEDNREIDPSIRWFGGLVRWFAAVFFLMAFGGTVALIYDLAWINTIAEVTVRLAVTIFLALTWLRVFVSPDIIESRTSPQAPVGDDLLDDIETRFLSLMDEGAYREADLSLDYCARKIGCPSQYLSYVLNRRLKTPFSDYIAARRIDDLIARLREGTLERQTILSLAFEVGFQSKSSFYAAFRRVTGETPTSFIKKDQLGSN